MYIYIEIRFYDTSIDFPWWVDIFWWTIFRVGVPMMEDPRKASKLLILLVGQTQTMRMGGSEIQFPAEKVSW